MSRYNVVAGNKIASLSSRLKWVVQEFVRIMQTLQCWSEVRRQRRSLLELDDHVLKDIGLTRADVDYEASKPFWYSRD